MLQNFLTLFLSRLNLQLINSDMLMIFLNGELVKVKL